MRRALRVLLWGLALLIGIAVLAGAVLLVWLHTDSGRDFVRARLERELDRNVRGDVSIGHLGGSVLGEVVLRDVEVIGPGGRLAARADSIWIDFDLVPLLRRRFEADRVTVRGLEVYDRGQLKTLWRKSGRQPTSWRVRVRKFSLDRGRYVRTRDDRRLVLDRARAAGRFAWSSERTRLEVAQASARWVGRQLPLSLSGELTVAGGVVLASGLQLRAGGSSARSAALVVVPEKELLLADVNADLASADLRELSGLEGWRGPIHLGGMIARAGGGPWRGLFSARAAGGDLAVEVSASARSVRGRLWGDRIDPAVLYAGAPQGALAVDARGALAFGAAAAPGGAFLEGARGHAEVRASGRLAGVSGAGLDLRAELDRDRLEVRARGRKLHLFSADVGSLSLRGQLEGLTRRPGGRVEIEAGSLSWSGRRLEALRIEARLEHGERIEGRVRATGGPQDSALRARVRVSLGRPIRVGLDDLRLRVADRLWRGRGRFAFRPGRALAIRTLKLSSGPATISVSGRIAGGGGRGRLTASVTGLELSTLPHEVLGIPPVRGRLRLHTTLDLSRRSLRGALAIQRFAWRAGAPPIEVRARLRPVRRAVEVDLRARGGRLGRLTARALGRLPPRPLSPASWRRLGRRALREARVELHSLRLGHLAPLFGAPAAIEGVASGVVEIERGFRKGRADVEIEGARTDQIERPVGLELHAQGGPGSIRIKGIASLDARPMVTGEVELARGLSALWRGGAGAAAGAALRGRFYAPDVPIDALAGAFGLEPEIAGRVFAELQLSGSLSRPRWRLEARSFGLRAGAVSFERVALEARGGGERIEASLQARQRRGGSLQATFEGALARRARIHASLTAERFRLRSLTAPIGAFGARDAGGVVTAKLEISGRLPTPSIEGWAHLRDGRVRLPVGVRSLEDVSMDVRIDDKRLDLTASARSGGGRASLKADATLHGLLPEKLEARFEARRLPLLVGGLHARVSTKARASGHLTGDLWRGRVKIESGRLDLPAGLGREKLHPIGKPEDVVFASKAHRESVLERAAPRGPWLRLDLSTVRPVYLRGDGKVRGRVSANLVLTMVDSTALLQGSARATDASLELFDRRYRVERAVVTFNGAEPPDPALSIALSHEFAEATVTITLSGTASDPEVELTSDRGSYSRSELLAFVVGGRPSAGPSGATAGLAGGAASLVSEFLAGRLESALQRGIPLDVIRFGTSAEETGVSEVTVGKWVSDSLFVAYRRRFEAQPDENANEAQFEYYIGSKWLLRGAVGDRGQGYVDILWVKRY